MSSFEYTVARRLPTTTYVDNLSFGSSIAPALFGNSRISKNDDVKFCIKYGVSHTGTTGKVLIPLRALQNVLKNSSTIIKIIPLKITSLCWDLNFSIRLMILNGIFEIYRSNSSFRWNVQKSSASENNFCTDRATFRFVNVHPSNLLGSPDSMICQLIYVYRLMWHSTRHYRWSF